MQKSGQTPSQNLHELCAPLCEMQIHGNAGPERKQYFTLVKLCHCAGECFVYQVGHIVCGGRAVGSSPLSTFPTNVLALGRAVVPRGGGMQRGV
jgi:hypothetical protein